MSSCCPNSQPISEGHCHPSKKIDYLFWTCLFIIVASYLSYIGQSFIPLLPSSWMHFPHAIYELVNKMWWGLALGTFFVGLLNLIPRDFIISILGQHKGLKGLLRATLLGLLLDLCSHGILLVGMKLYERGASLGQTMAFLIASPWNSLSLTFILIALIGLPWTLFFILCSAIIAILSGTFFDYFVSKNILKEKQRSLDLPKDFKLIPEAKKLWRETPFSIQTFVTIIVDGIKDSRPIMKWLFFGIVVAGLLQAFVPTDFLKTYFGPSLLGLMLTLAATTVIEVCSEGSTPIAADIFNRAGAPGNAFTFLMAGVSTDYTEIMAIKESTQSWKISLFLPLVTVPQVLLISYLMNL
ncbi:MAG: permease [Bdellovibrionales bacterium]|nr:permease [Bdellovibrionales bacterium]